MIRFITKRLSFSIRIIFEIEIETFVQVHSLIIRVTNFHSVANHFRIRFNRKLDLDGCPNVEEVWHIFSFLPRFQCKPHPIFSLPPFVFRRNIVRTRNSFIIIKRRTVAKGKIYETLLTDCRTTKRSKNCRRGFYFAFFVSTILLSSFSCSFDDYEI